MAITKIVTGILAAIIMAGCTQGGTEVLNPSETIVMKGVNATYSLDIMNGWTYAICSESPAGCAGAYQDPLGTSTALAVLDKGASNSVLFEGLIPAGQTFVQYVDARIDPTAEKSTETVEGVTVVLVGNEPVGAHGGAVMHIFMFTGNMVAWMRVELVPTAGMTEEEFTALANEWLQTAGSLAISEN